MCLCIAVVSDADAAHCADKVSTSTQRVNIYLTKSDEMTIIIFIQITLGYTLPEKLTNLEHSE